MELQLYLVQCLATMTVDGLKELARDNYIKGYSKLRKNELVPYLALRLLWEPHVKDVMIHSLSSEMSMMEQAMDETLILSEKTRAVSYWGERGLVYTMLNGRVFVPCDVKQVFDKIRKNPEFEQKRKESELLELYCRAFANLYQIIPVKQCVEIINQQNSMNLTIPDFIQWENERYYIRNGYDFVYQDGYITTDEFCRENGPDYRELLKQQRDQAYYIPNRTELLKYAELDYVEETKAYREFRRYLRNVLLLTADKAAFAAVRIQLLIRRNYPMETLIQEMEDAGIKAANPEQLYNLKVRLADLFLHSRLPLHRGHTPNELKEINLERYHSLYGNMAYTIQDALKPEPAKVVPYPIESVLINDFKPKEKPVQRTEAKVYPNDPCPCGSGRKYKKCCGRK